MYHAFFPPRGNTRIGRASWRSELHVWREMSMWYDAFSVSVLLQCAVAVCCCSVLFQRVVAVCCCSVLLHASRRSRQYTYVCTSVYIYTHMTFHFCRGNCRTSRHYWGHGNICYNVYIHMIHFLYNVYIHTHDTLFVLFYGNLRTSRHHPDHGDICTYTIHIYITGDICTYTIYIYITPFCASL